jgi:hypothetical protein
MTHWTSNNVVMVVMMMMWVRMVMMRMETMLLSPHRWMMMRLPAV